MPKEHINNRYWGQEDNRLDDSFVKVGWSKETGHVEIAVMRESDNEVDNDRWHSQFDRYGINRLIKVLRQARDDAFGRDE